MVLKKNHIFFLKSKIFNAWKKILLKEVDFFIIFVHMNVHNFRNIKSDGSFFLFMDTFLTKL